MRPFPALTALTILLSNLTLGGGAAPGAEPPPEQLPLATAEPLHAPPPQSLTYEPIDHPWSPTTEPLDNWENAWGWEILPSELIYKSYLAGVKEPRIGSVWFHDKGEGWLWDSTLGGRVGLIRYGTLGDERPEGWQLDLEGAAFVRLDPIEDRDLQSADFRFGFPLTWGKGNWQAKFGYYHLSSHLGDEFSLKNPTYMRNNYSRDCLVLGVGYFVTPAVRLYGETAFGMYVSGPAQPWEFQFGAEYSPPYVPGRPIAPFWALNGHLRQELNFGGNFVAQAGWQIRGRPYGPLFRAGLQYYNGGSPQMQFYSRSEQQFGFGLWYDY
ncbi:MAG: DUF1207 domain-containing protein [Pirellulales bacterium]